MPIAVALLFALALVVGLRGIASLPPDEHEILVLRSAHEMHARGDWVVPYFNDQPRLKKPPLSYWLTGLTAWAAGAEGRIEAWHGRTPSLLAGLAMLGMILWAGVRFHGARAAFYAGGLFATSVGFFTYTHDGRPDFLYAALCTAGWLAGAVGLVEHRGTRALPIMLMWLAFGAATLAKGPHVPLMLVVAMAIHCALRGPPPTRLRPLAGVALLLLVALPWWLALHARIDPNAVRGSQLAGKLLVPRVSHLLNGYYLYRPLQLLLPWVPLVPVAWFALVRERQAGRDIGLFLALCAGAVALGLSFGGQQRYFYMLPVLPALCLLAGLGLAAWEDRQPRLAVATTALQSALVVAGAGWLFWRAGALVSLVGALLAAVAVGLWLGWRRQWRAGGALAVGLVVCAATFARFADGDVLWSVARFQRHALAHAVAASVPPEQPLFSYGLTPVIYIQVTGRAIPEYTTVGALEQAMRERHLHEAHVLALVRRTAELAERFDVKSVARMPAKANDRAGLFLLTLREGDPR